MSSNSVAPGFAFSAEQQGIVAAERVGFRFGAKGTHTSRTIMFYELSTLLRAATPLATRDEYRSLIIHSNCLGNPGATRAPSTRAGVECFWEKLPGLNWAGVDTLEFAPETSFQFEGPAFASHC